MDDSGCDATDRCSSGGASATNTCAAEPPTDTNYNHQCYICDKIFSANSNLNRHLRKIHQENVQSPYNNVKCALCDSVYSSSHIYTMHLEKEHQVKTEVEQLSFASKRAFEEWKYTVESETTSQFIKSRGEKKSNNVNKTYYSCNRSGYYVSKARTRKALKKQGTRKINGRCPASMNVTVNPDSSYQVRFVKTHVGHDFELKHLDLSDKDRDLIVQKLSAGLTKRDIIKQLRLTIEHQQQLAQTHITAASISTDLLAASKQLPTTCLETSNRSIEIVPTTTVSQLSAILSPNTVSTPDNQEVGPNSPSDIAAAVVGTCNYPISTTTNPNSQPTSRLHLATTKDIHNIINSKHLDSKLIRHNYDLNNVEAWINEMTEPNEMSSVLLYKSQSQLVERFSQLKEEDFMLAIMKPGQAEILKTYGDKCIIIDSTHSVHCEYLQILIMSVIDDSEKGFPVAFLFSTRTDVETLEVFYTLIRERAGVITPRILIADELDDFYIAWTRVMTRPTHNLLTPWSVFDAWSKKFDLIKNKDKLRKMKKSLRALLTESEANKFNKTLIQVVEDNKNDKDMEEFLSFFESSFSKNPDLWSSCLRRAHGVSNFQLWRLHDKFKLVYKKGKNSKKLCKYIAGLMTLFEELQLDTLSSIEDKNPCKHRALLNRHKKSSELGSCVYELAVEPVYWLCPSETSNEYYYEVRHETRAFDSTTNCCDLKCPSCNTCRHGYKCTCLDYVFNLNMCKHIHQICTMCKQ